MKFKPLLLLGLIALLAAGGYFFFAKYKAAKQQAMMQMMANRTPEVTFIEIKKEPVQTFRELPARISAYRISEVRPQAEGIIHKRLFEEGSYVEKGQQLYQIDPRLYDISYKNAKVSYERMRARRDRYRALLKEDAISKQEFEDSQADFAAAEAEFKRATTNLEYSKVLAPISGYIGRSNITEGALATVNQATVLTTITQLDPIFVDMIQPSKESIKLTLPKDTAVSLLVDDEKYEQNGLLKFSEKFADEGTDSVRLRAEFPNPNGQLIPGMFVTAHLHLPLFEAITISQRTTMRAPDGSLFVYVLGNDNVVKQRAIKASQTLGDRWIITEGLEIGEKIIYEGIQKIADGAAVKASPANLENK